MPAISTRTKMLGAMVGAFTCGLIFASGLDLTRFGYAQSRSSATTTQVANTVVPAASVAQLNGSFVDLAERLTPAVVSIEAARENRPRAQGNQREAPRVPRGFEEFFEQFDPRQRQQPSQASGSGFIVSRDGYILTNNHVVADFDRVRVTLTDRRSFDAKVVGRDATTDVAVLKIDGSNLPVAALGDDAAVRIGEWVLAIGNPLGLDFTVTAGIISAKGRGAPDLPGLGGGDYGITDMIQTDAAINPGNSGGPLVNIRGEVIGINAAIASNTGLYSGYGFAIPITLAKTVMDDILEHGRVRRAVLGVSITEVNAATAKRAKLSEISGVLVTGFPEGMPDSPARRAGIELGDVIVRADGKRADHVATLQRIIRNFEPGETVALEVVRNGERKNISIKLAEAPNAASPVARASEARNNRESVIFDRLGIGVEPISDAAAREYEVPAEHRGLRVVDISATGPARAGLSQLDVISAVLYPGPRKSIRSVDDISSVLEKLKPGDVVSLLVYNVRARATRVVDLELGDR